METQRTSRREGSGASAGNGEEESTEGADAFASLYSRASPRMNPMRYARRRLGSSMVWAARRRASAATAEQARTTRRRERSLRGRGSWWEASGCGILEAAAAGTGGGAGKRVEEWRGRRRVSLSSACVEDAERQRRAGA